MSIKSKSRLGRGLSSLMSVSALPVEAEVGQLAGDGSHARQVPDTAVSSAPPLVGQLEIPIDEIIPNPHQPRRTFLESSLQELANSMKSAGLIQPIIVRKEGDRYQLVAGERRWRAAKLAGLATIPALLRDVDSLTQAQMALIENIQREDLNAIDRAQAYESLTRQLGLTQAELATRLGEDRSTIANFMRLLELTESVREHVRAGRLSLGHAKLIAGVLDVLQQAKLADTVIKQELSVRNLERLIQTGEAPSPKAGHTPPAGQTAHLAELERSLTSQLGMRVQLRSTAKKSKGRLVIHYANLDQFDQLMEKLGLEASKE